MDIYRVTIADKKSGRPHHRLWLSYQSAMNCFHYWRNVTWRQRDAEDGEELYHPYTVSWDKISTTEDDWVPVNVATEREVRRLLDLWGRLHDGERQRVLQRFASQLGVPSAVVQLEEQPEVLSKDEKEEAFRRLSAPAATVMTEPEKQQLPQHVNWEVSCGQAST